jgi:hypothetical protein
MRLASGRHQDVPNPSHLAMLKYSDRERTSHLGLRRSKIVRPAKYLQCNEPANSRGRW